MAVLPLLRRPFDCLVVVFLVSHIPITVLFDSQGLFPTKHYPDFAQQVWGRYIAELHDPLITHMPIWFKVLVWSEVYLQLPFFFVATYAYVFGKNWIQKPAIIYGLFVSSTMVCILGELAFTPDPKHSPTLLCAIYLPYFLMPLAMALKMLLSSEPFASDTSTQKKSL